MNTNNLFINLKTTHMNTQQFTISPEMANMLTVLSGVIEKAFDRAEKRDQQRHDEAMKRLEIQQIEAEARAEKLRAEAEQIRSRVKSDLSFKRHVKNA